ncbi:MAG: hypothetical protein ACK56I_37290, partial [bacterium]
HRVDREQVLERRYGVEQCSPSAQNERQRLGSACLLGRTHADDRIPHAILEEELDVRSRQVTTRVERLALLEGELGATEQAAERRR